MSVKTTSIVLAEKAYELRFDVVALTSAHNVLKALGFKRDSVWTLADVPYDLGEEITLFLHGVNGAKRLAKETKLMQPDEAQEIFEQHFDWMAEKTAEIENEAEAMKVFQDEHLKVMEAISEAVRGSMGFQRKRGKGGSPTAPVG